MSRIHRSTAPARNWPVIAADLAWLMALLMLALALTAGVTWLIYDALLIATGGTP